MSTAAQPARHRLGIRTVPTRPGSRTQAAIDAAAPTVVACKGIVATTIADIAAEARCSAAFCSPQLSRDGAPDARRCA